jgi:quinoprotein glucose dehydrogenase
VLRHIAALTPVLLSAARPDGWPYYGHDAGGQRFSPLRQINSANVSRLHVAWIYHTGDQNPAPEKLPRGQRRLAFEATPLIIDDVLYISTPGNRVVALDPETGRERWAFDPWTSRPKPKDLHPNRGVAYWIGDDHDGPRIYYGTSDGRLIALDARTGRAVPTFADNGEINLRAGVADRFPQAQYDLSSPPVIFRDLVITGSEVQEKPGLGPAGDIRAFNAKTGKLVWQFHTVPRTGEANQETWKNDGWLDRSGTNTWSIMTLDPETGTLFAPIGSPAYDFYGGDRPGQNLYGNSLVALDAATGKLLWHYQFVHHDIWDYDPPAPPTLIRARGRPAVVEVNKTGLVFILDRRTGRPLFPVEERPVPQSDVPGESTWPTQPVPLKPPPLSRRAMTRADLTTVTPESHQYCAELFDKLANKGPYTPWSLKPTLVFPGTLGGGTWSGASYDPSRSLIFVNTNEVGAIGQLQPQPAGAAVRYQRTSPLGAYARFWDTHLWPCQQPPWGLLNAINVNTGELVWRVPLGTVEELESRGIKNTGTPNIGGSITTAGGLVFIGATTDGRFRAFDAATGNELWSAKLPASAYATPATYMTKNGRQFVVIAAGGGGFFSERTADTLVPFSL